MDYCPAPINNNDNIYDDISSCNIIHNLDSFNNNNYNDNYDNKLMNELVEINKELSNILSLESDNTYLIDKCIDELNQLNELNMSDNNTNIVTEHINDSDINDSDINDSDINNSDINDSDINNKSSKLSLLNNIDNNLELYSKNIDSFLKEYIDVKDKYLDKMMEFKKEIDINNKNIKQINTFINFMNSIITSDDKLNTNHMKVLEDINKLGKDIYNNSKINKVKKEYIEVRNKFDKYIAIVKKWNAFNTSNMCPCCLTNVVDRILTPCGHTICKDCLSNIDYNINIDNNCIICRNPIIKEYKIFFN